MALMMTSVVRDDIDGALETCEGSGVSSPVATRAACRVHRRDPAGLGVCHANP